MPRLKSITTGSIPSFVDLILNIDEGDTSSSLASQDTWLAQLKAKGTGKLLMYGDDTWLKLFPETFDRHDGTSSFFVSVCNLASLLLDINANSFVGFYRGGQQCYPKYCGGA